MQKRITHSTLKNKVNTTSAMAPHEFLVSSNRGIKGRILSNFIPLETKARANFRLDNPKIPQRVEARHEKTDEQVPWGISI
jgi:hypothetical protein